MRRLRFSIAIALCAFAALVAGCGGGGDNSDANPKEVVDSATLEGIDSGDVQLSVSIKASGREGGNVDFALNGPFRSRGEGQLPLLSLEANADGRFDGEDVDFKGGIVLLPNRGFVNYKGVDYEIDPTTFGFLESILQPVEPGAESEASAAGAAACQEELSQIDVGEFVENGSNEGSADVDGVETTKISGDLDVPAALDALIEVSGSQACASQAQAGPLPSRTELEDAKREVEGSVKSAKVDLYVGDDDIVRRLNANVRLESEEGKSGPSDANIAFDLVLSGVNDEPSIDPPSGAKPISELFIELGLNPIQLLGLLQGEGGLDEIPDLNGLPDLEGLLDNLRGSSGGNGSGNGSSGGGGNGSGGGNSGGGQGTGGGSYLDCVNGAQSPSDLQKCAQQQ